MYFVTVFIITQLLPPLLAISHQLREIGGAIGKLRQAENFQEILGTALHNYIRRDIPQGDFSHPRKPARIEQLPPVLRANAKRVRLYFGPYSIPGQNEHHILDPGQTDPDGLQINHYITGFCQNCTALYAKADTQFLNGTRARISSGLYNHHIVVLDREKKNLPWYLCDEKTGMGNQTEVGFMVSGVDEAPNYFTTLDKPYGSGYWIGAKQSQFFLNAELVNYRVTNLTIYITAEVEHMEGKVEGYSDTSVSLLSVTGCQHPENVPHHGEAQFSVTGPTFRIPLDGHIIHAKGHLHDGGVKVLFTLNGEVICDSRAIYGGDGSQSIRPDGKPWETIRTMTQCTKAFPVKAGDIINLTAFYDTGLHPLRQAADGHGDREAMGVFFINFTPKINIQGLKDFILQNERSAPGDI